MNELDRGAIAAIDLLLRAQTVTEDETTIQEHAETMRGVIASEGLPVAIRREMDFEAALDDPEFPVIEAYGPFPPDLAALAVPA